MAQPGFSQQQMLLQNLMEFSQREQARQEIADRIEEFKKRFGDEPQQDLPKTPPLTNVLPTPPNTIQKPNRVSVDVAPMPAFTEAPNYAFPATASDQAFMTDIVFRSQSSVVDQTSPMPTLLEEPAIALDSQASFPDHSTLLASSSQTALDLGISFSPTHCPLSPRSALVMNPDLNASIEETGISAEEVQAFIGEQDAVDGKWVCLFENCGKKFGRRENIKSHIQTHLGDRQYKCNECLKRFVRQHDLKRHAKIHSGERPHVCLCGHGFSRHDALTRHRQRGGCIGAFPNCFKRDVKRGRPRKMRPNMEDRVEKANRARRLDALVEADPEYLSSNSISCSDASQTSDAMTPPESNIFDAANYIDMQTIDEEYMNFPTHMEVTPPTSQLGSSPPQMYDSDEIASMSIGLEHLSAEGVSPEMLTLSPPSSDHLASSPSEHHTENNHSSSMDSGSPSQASVEEHPSDQLSLSNTPSPFFDDDIEKLICNIEKDPMSDKALMGVYDMDIFSSNMTAEVSPEAIMNGWLQNVT